MLDPGGRPNDRIDKDQRFEAKQPSSTRSITEWAARINTLSGAQRYEEVAKLLEDAIFYDDSTVIHGIANLGSVALNTPIDDPFRGNYRPKSSHREDADRHDTRHGALALAFQHEKFRVAAALLFHGADWIRSEDGSPFLEVALQHGLQSAVSRVIEIRRLSEALEDSTGSKFPKVPRITKELSEAIIKFDWLYPKLASRATVADSAIAKLLNLVRNKLNSTHPLRHIYDLVDAMAYVDQLTPHNNSVPAEYFSRTVFRVFASNKIQIALAVTRCIDELVYSDHALHTHPSQAELMLFFNHPSVSNSFRNTKLVNLALTAIDNFQKRELPDTSPQDISSIFARIGRYTFGFTRLKYDTRASADYPKSLVEEFGFAKQKSPSAADKFGECFVFEPPQNQSISVTYCDEFGNKAGTVLDGNTKLILRHGAIGVANPEYGAVWIRNSSRVFGRDSMIVPATFSRTMAENPRDLVNPDKLSDTLLIPCHEIFLTENRNAKSGLVVLLNQLDAFIRLYSAWKFDTDRYSAWTEEGKMSKFALHRSSGFKHIVDRLAAWHYESRSSRSNSKLVVPSLAFSSKAQLPFIHLPGSKEQTSLTGVTMTPRNLALLQELASEDQDNTELWSSTLWKFLNFAGVVNQGELILRDPRPGHEVE